MGTSQEIFSGISFPAGGVLPAVSLFGMGSGTSVLMNFAGPFDVPLDAGYLPWQSNANSVPELSINAPGNDFMVGQAIQLNGKASDVDREHGTPTFYSATSPALQANMPFS